MSSLAGALDDSHISRKAYDEEMSDLFGEEEDQPAVTRESASPTPSAADSEGLPSAEREHRHALEYEEDDAAQDLVEEVKEAELSLPNLPVPKASDGDHWVMRFPTYMSVDSKPFHPDTYVGAENEEDDHTNANREKSKMAIKLKVENTLRWRWTKDEYGQDQRQSNARYIRWSDGSLSLRVGKEIFDVDQSVDTAAAVPRALGGTQSQEPASTPVAASRNAQGLTYLVAQHKRSQVLQSEAVIKGYLTFKPTSMQSETHRLLVQAVGQKHNKVARLKMTADPLVDPEKERLEYAKQHARKPKKKSTIGPDGKPQKRASRRDSGYTWSSEDEIDSRPAYRASDDEEGYGSSGSPKKSKKRAGEGEDYQEDDFVVADESEDEGNSRRKRARDMDDEDDLERMEARLEKQAALKKNKSSSSKKKDYEDESDDDDHEMEVESEEEDTKVRRVSSKRAVPFEDEDD